MNTQAQEMEVLLHKVFLYPTRHSIFIFHILSSDAVTRSEGLNDLESVVECPVCLVVPRDLPIPCCPAGHIMCRSCRARVLHCPTCRRQLGDNTSSLAAALIERVKHRCQYSEFGCQHRDLLGGVSMVSTLFTPYRILI